MIKLANLFQLFVLSLTRTPTIRIADQANTRLLYRDLMKGYTKFLSPLPAENSRFARENDYKSEQESLFALRCDQIVLINLYESSGIFSIIMAVVLNYTDERLSWQPEHYKNITRIYVRWDALWIPPLTPISCESFSRPQFDDMTHAEIASDGSVEMNLVWTLSCNCTIIRCFNYFSFLDGSDGRDRVVTLSTQGTAKSNDVWYTSNVSVGEERWISGSGEEEKAYFYTIAIRRSSTYYLIFTIIPTLLQSVVSVLGMLAAGRPTKEDISARIALGVGSLTSIIFILSSMTGSIPKRDIPVLALFVMIEMIIIVVGIVYLALNPARLFLMLIPKKGGRQLLSIDTRREIKSARVIILLFFHRHMHRLFLMFLLTASSCNLGLNIVQYYRSE
ncbi:hypothetical protein PRIPAC_75631 [Pristionchus pacificus]|uniref:Transmembrane ion channel n=1 Tax=Pristionchus pacificus TaxID=54126 RepID=A0A2A6C6R1_PRIPA|nr:hypothetical protein PRIPAC_75631 [Pristionchus pacificus]|eukprot:PDM73902.1 transmembrane ion channel [Pristionchus pacificus]